MDIVEFSKAIAWPIATIIAVVAAGFVVWLVISRNAEVDMSAWDKIRFGIRTKRVVDQTISAALDGVRNVPEPESGDLSKINKAIDTSDINTSEETEDISFRFIFSRNEKDLDSGFEKFRSSSDYNDPEFWETVYQDRRFALGTGGTEDDLRRLAQVNSQWAAPYAILIRRAVENHDVAAAQSVLDQALHRNNSKHFDWVLREGINFIYKLRGARQALQFCFDRCKETNDSSVISSIFNTIAHLLKIDNKIDGYRLATEISLSNLPSQNSKRFELAYSYGERSSYWPASIEHYRQLQNDEEEKPMSLNNLGVQLAPFDKASQIDAYESAHDAGNPLATANLARLLIEDGFIAAGERLLNGIAEPGSAAENIAAARTEALKARRVMKENQEDIFRSSEQQFGLFKATILQSYRFIRENPLQIFGEYRSKDNNAKVLFDADGALCSVSISSSLYDGRLKDQIFCYSGIISSQGKSLMDIKFRDVTILQISSTSVRIAIWPQSAATESNIEIFDLTKIQSTEDQVSGQTT